MDETTNGDGLARRADTLGALAWRLVGDADTPPDPTAVYPLCDALRAEGMTTEVNRLADQVIRAARRVALNDRVERLDYLIDRFRDILTEFMGWLLWDLSSAVSALAGAFAAAAAPQPVEEVTTATTVVRWRPTGRRPGQGDRVVLPDGRGGLVIDSRDHTGAVVVLVTEEQPAAEGAG